MLAYKYPSFNNILIPIPENSVALAALFSFGEKIKRSGKNLLVKKKN